MSQHHFNIQDWFAYIQKLTDREMEKRNSTGITLWALIGVIVLIVFRIVDSFDDVAFSTIYFDRIVLYFTILLNFWIFLFTSFFIYYIRFLNFSNINGTGSEYRRVMSLIQNFSFSLVMLLGSASNFYSFYIVSKNHLFSWVFIILAVLLTLNVIVDQFSNFSKRFNNKIEKSVHSHLVKANVTYSKAAFIPYMILLVLVICSLWSINVNVNVDKAAIEFSLYLNGILFCLFIVSYLYSSYLRSLWLEGFEKRIMLENLSAEQIREEFNKHYPE